MAVKPDFAHVRVRNIYSSRALHNAAKGARVDAFDASLQRLVCCNRRVGGRSLKAGRVLSLNV